jgi:hypothetical protein
MKTILLILMVLASVARAESLCDMQIVSQIFGARYGKDVTEMPTPFDYSQIFCFNIYDQPTFRVVVVVGPPEGRSWASAIYFVSKRATFTKAEAQQISSIMSELPGTYTKENSATQISFELESYFN